MNSNHHLPLVIVTVPHSKCPYISRGHGCDTASLPSAEQLCKSMNATGMLQTTLFIADIHRGECDLNHIECRDTAFRRGIREYISSNRNRIALVLDVHSYPDKYTDFGPTDITILDDDTDGSGEFESYSWSLFDAIATLGVPIGLLQGGGNDIQIESKSLGIPSILIEFNERLRDSENDSYTQTIIDTVTNWIVGFVRRIHSDV